jgi:glycosyltransferase involved in cell wall biosynthesis
MTFFFDCRFIRVDHHDGISRFSSELFTATSGKLPVTALISDLRQLKYLPEGTEHLLINDAKNPWQELWLPKKLNAHGASVVFSPMQTMGSIGKNYKLILTLHDLIYYKHRKPPGSLSWPIRLAWRIFHLGFGPVRLLLNRADSVVTISQTTKTLIEANRLTKKPVHVVSNASSMPAVSTPKSAPRTKSLLYMGSFMPYKNVETLIRAMELLPEYTLVLCSKVSKTRKDQLLKATSKEVRLRIHFADGVTEEKYLELLDDSFALVSASMDEGFGIPLIEAMSRSIPIVVSDIQIFREVANEAAVFFNPVSPDDFAKAVKKLELGDSWQQASNRGLERSRHFDWNLSATELIKVVESLRG